MDFASRCVDVHNHLLATRTPTRTPHPQISGLPLPTSSLGCPFLLLMPALWTLCRWMLGLTLTCCLPRHSRLHRVVPGGHGSPLEAPGPFSSAFSRLHRHSPFSPELNLFHRHTWLSTSLWCPDAYVDSLMPLQMTSTCMPNLRRRGWSQRIFAAACNP